MVPKVIKNEAEYEAALARIDELMDAAPSTPEGDELELLTTLVELYEEEVHPVDHPDPVSAIRFRMEQAGLRQKDLIPFIGSGSKVSEVLSGRRPLSIAMIRNLNEGLGIPLEVLIRKTPALPPPILQGMRWEDFPTKEVLKRKWWPHFEGTLGEARARIEELVAAWVAPLGSGVAQQAFLRQHVRTGSEMNTVALAAWRIRVSLVALERKAPKYRDGTITFEFVRDLLRLSYFEQGPTLAREFLLKSGIRFVVERHLPRTHLDGAAIRLPDGSPLVALTLRHDRLDNFWFTLCHELAHVALHLAGEATGVIFDDLDHVTTDDCEEEANRWAAEAMIPAEVWEKENLAGEPSARRVMELASRLRIHPAIPAGRIRKESGNYKILNELVGHRQARRHFAQA